MSSSGTTFIHFGCPHCTAPLKAPAELVGRRQQCPLCYWPVQVPRESRPVDVEQYGLDNAADPWLRAQPQTISMTCPVCRSHVTAAEEQVGQEVHCPDCRTPLVVPPPSEPRRRKRPVPLEEYAMCADYDPASLPHHAPAKYIPVHCGLCNTLIQATPDQIGQTLACPDCATAVVVRAPPPVHTSAADLAAPGMEPYAVREDQGALAGLFRGAGPQPIPLHLRHASQRPVGRSWPRDHLPRLPPAPHRAHAPIRETQARGMAEGEGQYEVSRRDEKTAPLLAISWPQRLVARHRGEIPADRPPPRRPMVSGVLGFPWQPSVRMQWLGLSIAAVLIVEVGYSAWNMSVSGGIGGVGAALISLCSYGLAFCFGGWWLGVLFISLLTILGETAAGGDEVAEWPNPLAFADWAGNAVFMVNGVALTALPGVGAAWLLAQVNLPSAGIVPCSLFLLFPFVLMSMLEANSAVIPFSAAVFRTLAGHWRAWLAFYLETAILLVAAGAIVTLGSLPGSPLLATSVAAPTVVAAAMIYFRLLGRLGWCCSRAS